MPGITRDRGTVLGDLHFAFISMVVTITVPMLAAKALLGKIPLSVGIDIWPWAAQMTFITTLAAGRLAHTMAPSRLFLANGFVFLFSLCR
jgi:hypothetical protein